MADEFFVGRYAEDGNEAKASPGARHPHEWPELLATVPGVTELAAEGFVPVEKLFSDEGVVAAWPKAHRRIVKETRYELTGLEPFDKRWGYRLFLVRSPWPEVGLDQVNKLLRRWLSRAEHIGLDEKARLAAIRQFFRQDEAWVRAYSKGRVNRLK